jgi:HEPN domain-containing protein
MPKAKKTPEEIAEDNKRTNEGGLFHYADAYLVCAKQLVENSPSGLRFDAPIDFLLFHAAELYLKSYLRRKGEDVEALTNLRHYHLRMCKKAATFGMNIPSEIYDLFKFLDETDAVIVSRYIKTGPTTRITKELLTVVEELRAKVQISHQAAGVTLAATQGLP